MFEVLDPQPADPPALIELPPGLQPLEDVLLLIGITDLLGPPLTSTSSPPGGEGGGPGGGSGGSGQNPETHTASFIIPIEYGQIDIGLEWRIQRFGTYLEATALVTISPVENVTLHQEYAGAFTLRRESDYEARYTGALFSLDAPEPITMEVSGRLRSGVNEEESPGLVFETTLPETEPVLIPANVWVFGFVADPEEGSPRASDGPGFQYCGGTCTCPVNPGETVEQNTCPLKRSSQDCTSETCRVQPNSRTPHCVWTGGGWCASGASAGMVGSILGLAGLGLMGQGRRRRIADFQRHVEPWA